MISASSGYGQRATWCPAVSRCLERVPTGLCARVDNAMRFEALRRLLSCHGASTLPVQQLPSGNSSRTRVRHANDTEPVSWQSHASSVNDDTPAGLYKTLCITTSPVTPTVPSVSTAVTGQACMCPSWPDMGSRHGAAGYRCRELVQTRAPSMPHLPRRRTRTCCADADVLHAATMQTPFMVRQRSALSCTASAQAYSPSGST